MSYFDFLEPLIEIYLLDNDIITQSPINDGQGINDGGEDDDIHMGPFF